MNLLQFFGVGVQRVLEYFGGGGVAQNKSIALFKERKWPLKAIV